MLENHKERLSENNQILLEVIEAAGLRESVINLIKAKKKVINE